MGSIKKAFDLTGKTALITGGSRGLGLQIAEALGEQGAKIVLSSRKAGDLEEAQKHLAKLGIEADWIAADNSKDEDIKRLADGAIAKLGKVDILVNNAGATWGALTEDHPIEAWDKLMNLNIRALFVLSQQIGKKSMIPNKYGRIINLASVAGRELHPRPCGQLGAPWHHGQRACARILPVENDEGSDRISWGRQVDRRCAASPPWRR